MDDMPERSSIIISPLTQKAEQFIQKELNLSNKSKGSPRNKINKRYEESVQ